MYTNLTENVAYIEIKNYASLSWDNLKKASGGTSLSSAGASVLSQAKSKLSGLTSTAVSAISSGSRKTRGIDDGVIKVQYNPTSLTFNGSTKAGSDSTLVEAQKQQITTIPSWGILTMSVDLEFTSSSVTDTSVMDEMTALLKMMQKSPTKEITFSWADMVVEGKVTSFSGEYMSFYPTGLPKSGKISLKLEAEAEPKKIEAKIEKMAAEKSDKLAAK